MIVHKPLRKYFEDYARLIETAKGAVASAQEIIDRLDQRGIPLRHFIYEVANRSYGVVAPTSGDALQALKEHFETYVPENIPVFANVVLVRKEPVTAEWLVTHFNRSFVDETVEQYRIEFASGRSGPRDVMQSSIENLCKAVDIHYYPVKETVYFGHGGGHNPQMLGLGTFYVDLDLLHGESKTERMQNALEVLAKDLGSREALRSLGASKVLDMGTGEAHWPTGDVAPTISMDLPSVWHREAMRLLVKGNEANIAPFDFTRMLADLARPSDGYADTFNFDPAYATCLSIFAEDMATKLRAGSVPSAVWEEVEPGIVLGLADQIHAEQRRLTPPHTKGR